MLCIDLFVTENYLAPSVAVAFTGDMTEIPHRNFDCAVRIGNQSGSVKSRVQKTRFRFRPSH